MAVYNRNAPSDSEYHSTRYIVNILLYSYRISSVHGKQNRVGEYNGHRIFMGKNKNETREKEPTRRVDLSINVVTVSS